MDTFQVGQRTWISLGTQLANSAWQLRRLEPDLDDSVDVVVAVGRHRRRRRSGRHRRRRFRHWTWLKEKTSAYQF